MSTVRKRIQIRATSKLNGKFSQDGKPIFKFRLHFTSVDAQGDNDHLLAWFCHHIVVRLHPTFTNPKREIKPPFILEEEAWGSFDVGLSFHFRDEFHVPIQVSYDLKLEKEEDEVVRALIFRNLSLEAKKKYFELPMDGLSPKSLSSNTLRTVGSPNARSRSILSKNVPQSNPYAKVRTSYKGTSRSGAGIPESSPYKENPPKHAKRSENDHDGLKKRPSVRPTDSDTESDEEMRPKRGRVNSTNSSSQRAKHGVSKGVSEWENDPDNQINERRLRLSKKLRVLEPPESLEIARIIYSHLGEEGFLSVDHIKNSFTFSLNNFPNSLLDALSDFVSTLEGPKLSSFT